MRLLSGLRRLVAPAGSIEWPHHEEASSSQFGTRTRPRPPLGTPLNFAGTGLSELLLSVDITRLIMPVANCYRSANCGCQQCNFKFQDTDPRSTMGCSTRNVHLARVANVADALSRLWAVAVWKARLEAPSPSPSLPVRFKLKFKLRAGAGHGAVNPSIPRRQPKLPCVSHGPRLRPSNIPDLT